MRSHNTWLGIGVAALAAAVVLGSGVRAAVPAAPLSRTVFISATDSKGAAVTDLTAADLVVKEGGKQQTISSVAAATDPMQVAIIVEDQGTGMFQYGVAQFIQSLLEHAEFSVTLVTSQGTKIVDYTKDVDALKGAIGKLAQRPKSTPDGDQIPETISDTAKELTKKNAARPVIAVLTMSGEAHSAVSPNDVLDVLRGSGAILYVLTVPGTPTEQVLGDGPKQSGGRFEQISTSAQAGDIMQKIAATLLHQYAVTYTLPDGVKPNQSLNVTTTRKGVTLQAPTRIKDK
jgi:hypothetical protein